MWEGWKKLSGYNKFGVWENLESMWFDYIEETRDEGNQGRRKKHKSNLEDKDVDPPLPDLPCVAAKMVFLGDEDYQPDCPWKISGIERAIRDELDARLGNPFGIPRNSTINPIWDLLNSGIFIGILFF